MQKVPEVLVDNVKKKYQKINSELDSYWMMIISLQVIGIIWTVFISNPDIKHLKIKTSHKKSMEYKI